MSSDRLYRPGLRGCSSNTCIISPPAPGAAGTNGQCTCERYIRQAPHGFEAVQTITYLRRQLAEALAK